MFPSQIAAQYGDDVAAQALNRSSYIHDPYDKERDSYAISTAANPSLTAPHSRAPSTLTTGYNSQTSLRPQSGVALYDRSRDTRDTWGPGQTYTDVDETSRLGTTGSVSDAERERERGYQHPGAGVTGWAQ